MNKQSTESKTRRDLTSKYLKWQAKITVSLGISIDEIRPKLYKRYEIKTGLNPWINSKSLQIMTNIQSKIDLLELVSERSKDFWNKIKIFPEKEMIFERVLEPRLFEDKEINELVKKLQFNFIFPIIDRARLHDKFYNLISEYIKLKKEIDELKNENIKIKTENTKLKHDKEEVEIENIKLKQNLDKFKKELKFKKNHKFQKKCILIFQVLLGEKSIIEYRLPFLNGLEFDVFFQKCQIALEVQGAQHRLHNTS
ncbi:hypothetical protein Glove_25g58 [Diversispora epigaea]|uniref:Uncharacterized protein n=1 Tax=Diversispora epigaea TaxID=1348612 RepID=A0A397JSM7_9GLOM|nr:hypothetical protein Glove_25g58 [Diversispora epigaea]